MNLYYDIVVIGGGPAGVSSAISAARNGQKVLLIERYGFLGGNMTAGLVSPFMPYYTESKVLQKGIFEEVIDLLKTSESYGGVGDYDSFNTEEMKLILQNLVIDSRCDLLLHTFVCGCSITGSKLESVECYSKSGNFKVYGKQFIDCTGDADIAAKCGFEFECGRTEDKKMQPMTLMFKMSNVSIDYKGYEKAVLNHDLPQGRVLIFGTPQKGVVSVNMTRVLGLSGIDVFDLTKAEIEARNQVPKIVKYLKKNVPGFENSYLSETATQIGVRETRRIKGSYTIDKNHIFDYLKNDDDVAYCNFKIDIHQPDGNETDIKILADKNGYYGIPFRAMVPINSTNLIVAGRPISSTHEAHASLRIMPTCFGMGEAAGKIASYCVTANKNTSNVIKENKIKDILGGLL